MDLRLLRAAAMAAMLAIAAACGGSTSTSAPAIRLTAPQRGGTAYIEVTGLSDQTVDAIRGANYSPEQWADILRVAVSDDAPPMLGSHRIADGSLRFTPAFPFDPGRKYAVRFDASRLSGVRPADAQPLVATVALPAPNVTPSTVVTQVYPSGDVVPENLLRMYVEFSAPMGRRSGIEYMKVLNESGAEIRGAILPLDYEFWSPDRKRFTVFLDPGRVKDGILPNREEGRPLSGGGSMTLAIGREWRDENGVPLKSDYRRTFRVTVADTKPIDTAAWRIVAPAAGGRGALTVTFPEPLDRGLLMRALGVRRDGEVIDGEITIDGGETRWLFTPAEPWRAGSYSLLALDILEDLAGNQIGRAFEVDNFDSVDRGPNPLTRTLPFVIR